MARYYYDKYSVTSSTSYQWSKYAMENVYFNKVVDTWNASHNSVDVWPSYTFNSKTGVFTSSGAMFTIYKGGSGSGWVASGNTATHWSSGSTYMAATMYQSYLSSQEVGSLVGTEWGSYYAHESGAVNSDGYYWVRGNSSTSYYRGSYIETIAAELGTYPSNGRSGSYWYVLGGRAFPDFKIRQNGQLKSSVDGWVRVNGQLKQIQQIWVRVNGQLKEI